jgi:hypothetical protein
MLMFTWNKSVPGFDTYSLKIVKNGNVLYSFTSKTDRHFTSGEVGLLCAVLSV